MIKELISISNYLFFDKKLALNNFHDHSIMGDFLCPKLMNMILETTNLWADNNG